MQHCIIVVILNTTMVKFLQWLQNQWKIGNYNHCNWQFFPVNFNHMSFNSSKCKFMLISHKWNRMTNPPTITINGNALETACPALETVPTFNYLGLLFTSNLSWSRHIKGVCTKTKKILGLLYCRFYQHADQQTLCQLYISIVRPHMEYAASVWNLKTCLKAHKNSHVKWWLKHGQRLWWALDYD